MEEICPEKAVQEEDLCGTMGQPFSVTVHTKNTTKENLLDPFNKDSINDILNNVGYTL